MRRFIYLLLAMLCMFTFTQNPRHIMPDYGFVFFFLLAFLFAIFMNAAITEVAGGKLVLYENEYDDLLHMKTNCASLTIDKSKKRFYGKVTYGKFWKRRTEEFDYSIDELEGIATRYGTKSEFLKDLLLGGSLFDLLKTDASYENQMYLVTKEGVSHMIYTASQYEVRDFIPIVPMISGWFVRNLGQYSVEKLKYLFARLEKAGCSLEKCSFPRKTIDGNQRFHVNMK